MYSFPWKASKWAWQTRFIVDLLARELQRPAYGLKNNWVQADKTFTLIITPACNTIGYLPLGDYFFKENLKGGYYRQMLLPYGALDH